MTGCFVSLPIETLTTIDGDIKCEFRVGQNARFIDSAVDTDVVFDKEEFIKLFNEDSQYDPNYYKNHLDKCDLKINTEEQPEEWEKMFNAEINIKAIYGEESRSVDVFLYDSKLYFFVVSMGGRSKPEEIGSYYIELSDESAAYWRPIIDQVLMDSQLTVEKVIELSKKGDNLTWEDFKQYKSVEKGSGLYIRSYDIDENFGLVIGGSSSTGKPMYITLYSKATGNEIDIRVEDVEAFVSAQK